MLPRPIPFLARPTHAVTVSSDPSILDFRLEQEVSDSARCSPSNEGGGLHGVAMFSVFVLLHTLHAIIILRYAYSDSPRDAETLPAQRSVNPIARLAHDCAYLRLPVVRDSGLDAI